MKCPDRRTGLAAWFGLILLLVASRQGVAALPAFELKDGDRVVLLGGTFIEREPSYGHIEAMLTSEPASANGQHPANGERKPAASGEGKGNLADRIRALQLKASRLPAAT